MSKGLLQMHLFVGDDALPVENASVVVQKPNGGDVLFELTTDKNGLTEKVPLEAPSKEYSIKPGSTVLPFAIYEVEVYAIGFKRKIIRGVEIFDGETAILPVQMLPAIKGGTPQENVDEIIIPLEHGVDLPSSAPPAMEVFNPYDPENMNIASPPLANEVAVPQYITVHLGSPNAAASNVRVPFIDYIKNVASSEIFPTWHESALYANIYCQISFALNRIHTVWYRSRGFDFDITNNTAFDQFFVYGRNIFENISRIVDGIFNMFIRRPGRREPFFAQYCNGTTSTCDGLSQWGSQDLALRGYSPIQILRYYYPNDVQIVQSNNFGADVGVYPGAPLKEGSTGSNVQTMQRYLNRISGNFYIPAIPNPNGVFGATTRTSTTSFQGINNLIADGIIGKSTWYSITKIYVAVKRLAELASEGERISVGATPPTTTIQQNARGEYVVELQFLLNYIAEFYPTVPFVVQDGVFRESTKRAVIEFQKQFGLTPDGVVGPATWQKLYSVYHSIDDTVVIPPIQPPIAAFPGVPLTIGSRGSDVLLMQNYLNAIAKVYPTLPTIAADGIFGPGTQAAVKAFQSKYGLKVDGIIGQDTWYKIVEVYNTLPSAPPTTETQTYTVVAGDTLYSIARRFNTTVDILKSLNNLTSDALYIGQQLLVPAQTTPPTPETQTYTVVAGDTLYLIARRFNTTVDVLKALNNLTSDALHIGQQLLVPASSATITHVVRAGDTLFALARQYNTTVEAIMSLNGLTSNVLHIGQTLLIPGGNA